MVGYKGPIVERWGLEGLPRRVLTDHGPRRRGGRFPARRARTPDPDKGADPSGAHDRFLRLDRQRAVREWTRYEGTAQRDLFRELRERFLGRHVRPGRWALDAGSGPGRFTSQVGGPGAVHVALDLSRAMLSVGRRRERMETRGPATRVERVHGDALRPPFPPSTFVEVALLGNTLGFEAGSGVELLGTVESLTAPGGLLVVEIAPGPGERSRYLARLPPSAVRRVLAAPPAAILPRLQREGFETEAVRHRPRSFQRWSVGDLLARWRDPDWHVLEVMAVSPALGPDAPRLDEVARDPGAWGRLLELEERLGRDPARWTDAAAVLVSVERRRSKQTIL